MSEISNVLPGVALRALQDALTDPRLPWRFHRYANYVDTESRDTNDYPQMVHDFFMHGAYSDHYRHISPLVAAVRSKFAIDAPLFRVKANLTLNTAKTSGGMGSIHADKESGLTVVFYPFNHESGTRIFAGHEVDVCSKENCAVCFPANMSHAMLVPKGVEPRFVVNMVFG